MIKIKLKVKETPQKKYFLDVEEMDETSLYDRGTYLFSNGDDSVTPCIFSKYMTLYNIVYDRTDKIQTFGNLDVLTGNYSDFILKKIKANEYRIFAIKKSSEPTASHFFPIRKFVNCYKRLKDVLDWQILKTDSGMRCFRSIKMPIADLYEIDQKLL